MKNKMTGDWLQDSPNANPVSLSVRMYQTLILQMSLTIQCPFAVTYDLMNQEFQICGKTPYSSVKGKVVSVLD
jgi:hypothetical protein